MTNPEYLWWAHTWHMQTPLETLGAGSFVAFELKEKVGLGTRLVEVICRTPSGDKQAESRNYRVSKSLDVTMANPVPKQNFASLT